MASPSHLSYQQQAQYEQPSTTSWSAPSSASSYLNRTISSSAGSQQGPPPEHLPRLDSVGSTHDSGSHLLPAGLMEGAGNLTDTSAGGVSRPSTNPSSSTRPLNSSENGDSHFSYASNAVSNDSSDIVTQLTQSKSQVASLQKKLRKSESQVEYLTKCCTEAGTELAKSHHNHTQTKKELQELVIQEKKSSIMAENARTSLRNVMAENVELREEVVRLRELLGRSGMGAAAAAASGGLNMDGVHGNGVMHGNPMYNQGLDQHQHQHQQEYHQQHHQQHQHQHQQQPISGVGGINSGLSGMNFGSTAAGVNTIGSHYRSNTPPPGTVPASSGTASGNSSLASPLESYQLTGSYPGKDTGSVGSLNKLPGVPPPNQLPSLAYSGSLGMASGGSTGLSSYDTGMADYNTAGIPSEAAARAMEREAATGPGGPGGRGTRGGRGSGRGGGGSGRGRPGGRGGGYRGRRN